MKGVIFTEFLEFSEQEFGIQIVEKAIASSDLTSGGAYTAVGTYDPRELVAILSRISCETGVPGNQLLSSFGRHLFRVLAHAYERLVAQASDSFSLLERVDNVIHVEVCKLYPDAQLPRFTHERENDDRLVLIYFSERAFADLAEGLLWGCIEHFGEAVRIERQDLSGGAGTKVRFVLQRIR